MDKFHERLSEWFTGSCYYMQEWTLVYKPVSDKSSSSVKAGEITHMKENRDSPWVSLTKYKQVRNGMPRQIFMFLINKDN